MEIGDHYKTFANRKEAAELLVPLLEDLKKSSPLVLAIPRGAVPMAHVVADALKAPMDLVLVKKIGHPFHPEFAIGAVTEFGEILLSTAAQEIEADVIENQVLSEISRLQQKRRLYTGTDRSHQIKGRTVIIVDDGIATGSTMIAAARSLKAQGAEKIVIATPVASSQAVDRLRSEGADVRAYYIPQYFGAVSYFYRDFDQVSDSEVGDYFRIRSIEIEIETKIKDIKLRAVLGEPVAPTGLIIFAHGSGSGRLSPRNQFLAETFNRHGLATLLADLLTEQEAKDRKNVFDIELLAQRVVALTEWAGLHPDFQNIPLGYLGASTGAAAALIAATRAPDQVRALVSRGGRPDLASSYLDKVECPVLLLVGGHDEGVIELNQEAFSKLKSEKELEIIPGATHLFEEPGALEKVADRSLHWFAENFRLEKIAEQRPEDNFSPPPL